MSPVSLSLMPTPEVTFNTLTYEEKIENFFLLLFCCTKLQLISYILQNLQNVFNHLHLPPASQYQAG